MADITELLRDASAGDAVASRALFERMYAELKRLAHGNLRRNGGRDELDTTMLVHEAYVKLASSRVLLPPDRAAFFAYVGKAMRSVVVDTIRERRAAKRGGGQVPLTTRRSRTSGCSRSTTRCTSWSGSLPTCARWWKCATSRGCRCRRSRRRSAVRCAASSATGRRRAPSCARCSKACDDDAARPAPRRVRAPVGADGRGARPAGARARALDRRARATRAGRSRTAAQPRGLGFRERRRVPRNPRGHRAASAARPRGSAFARRRVDRAVARAAPARPRRHGDGVARRARRRTVPAPGGAEARAPASRAGRRGALRAGTRDPRRARPPQHRAAARRGVRTRRPALPRARIRRGRGIDRVE